MLSLLLFFQAHAIHSGTENTLRAAKSPDNSFGDIDAKLKQLEEKTKDELGKLNIQASSLMQTDPSDEEGATEAETGSTEDPDDSHASDSGERVISLPRPGQVPKESEEAPPKEDWEIEKEDKDRLQKEKEGYTATCESECNRKVHRKDPQTLPNIPPTIQACVQECTYTAVDQAEARRKMEARAKEKEAQEEALAHYGATQRRMEGRQKMEAQREMEARAKEKEAQEEALGHDDETQSTEDPDESHASDEADYETRVINGHDDETP